MTHISVLYFYLCVSPNRSGLGLAAADDEDGDE